MARKKTTKITHIHVPTKIGLTVVGIAVLVYVLFITTIFNTNNQIATIQSNAATNIGPVAAKAKATPAPVNRCSETFKGGTCYDIYAHRCSRGYRQGYCPGPYDIQCCP